MRDYIPFLMIPFVPLIGMLLGWVLVVYLGRAGLWFLFPVILALLVVAASLKGDRRRGLLG